MCLKALLRMVPRTLSSWYKLCPTPLPWSSWCYWPFPVPRWLSLCCPCCSSRMSTLSGAGPVFMTYLQPYCELIPSPKTVVVWKVSDFLLSEKTQVEGLQSMILLKAILVTSFKWSPCALSMFHMKNNLDWLWGGYRLIQMATMKHGISDVIIILVTELLHLPYQFYVLYFILSRCGICKLWCIETELRKNFKNSQLKIMEIVLCVWNSEGLHILIVEKGTSASLSNWLFIIFLMGWISWLYVLLGWLYNTILCSVAKPCERNEIKGKVCNKRCSVVLSLKWYMSI